MAGSGDWTILNDAQRGTRSLGTTRLLKQLPPRCSDRNRHASEAICSHSVQAAFRAKARSRWLGQEVVRCTRARATNGSGISVRKGYPVQLKVEEGKATSGQPPQRNPFNTENGTTLCAVDTTWSPTFHPSLVPRGSPIQAAISRAPCRTRQTSVSASCST